VRDVSNDLVLYEDLFPFTRPPRLNSRNTNIVVTDTTLRDGQQGWRSFTVDEGLKIYEVLAKLGGSGAIETTELFLYTHKDRKLVSKIKELGFKYPKPVAWIRASFSDLKLVKDAGLDKAVILSSISDYQIYFKLGMSRESAIEKYVRVAEEALKSGIEVMSTLEDFTRADPEKNVLPLARRLMKLSERYGVPVRIKLADTLGLGLPFPDVPPPRGVPAVLKYIMEEAGVPGGWIEFHGHNDLGLVVANHLVAWLYGARSSNCTLLGIGERAGNCPLEVMLVHYVGIRGDDGTANLRAIKDAAELLKSMGFRVPEFHPLLGENAFRTKAGIHIDGLIKNPKVYLPFNPVEVLGVPYTISINPYSGKSAIALWVATRLDGGRVDPQRIKELKKDPRVEKAYSDVLKLFQEDSLRTSLNDEEVLEIIIKYFPEVRDTAVRNGVS